MLWICHLIFFELLFFMEIIGTILKINIFSFKKELIKPKNKSSKYNNLNEGKAIAINMKAGVIVQINSIRVTPSLRGRIFNKLQAI